MSAPNKPKAAKDGPSPGTTAAAIADLTGALYDLLRSPNVADDNCEAANLVDVGNDLARSVCNGLKWLGNGGTATTMGAIEAHGLKVHEGLEQVAGSLDRVADAIGDLAQAVRESGGKRKP